MMKKVWGRAGFGAVVLGFLAVGCPGGGPVDGDGEGGQAGMGMGATGSDGLGGEDGAGGSISVGAGGDVVTGGQTGTGGKNGNCTDTVDCNGVCGGPDLPSVYYADIDLDGLGDPTTGETMCPEPGRVENDLDCNDDIYGCQEDCEHCLSDGFLATATLLDSASGLGSSIAVLGDLDADGVPEIAVGRPLDDLVTIYFMNADGTPHHGSTVVREGGFGHALAAIGDLDGDGITELAVGAPSANYPTASSYCDYTQCPIGRVHVFFLTDAGFDAATEQVLDTPFPLVGADLIEPQFGIELASLGDVDGDDVPDLAAFQVQVDDGYPELGGVLILLLNANGSIKDFERIEFRDNLPWDVGDMVGVGDLDDNGVPDLAIVNEAIYLVYLTASGAPLTIEPIEDPELEKALTRAGVTLGGSLGAWDGMLPLAGRLSFFAADATSGALVGIEADASGTFRELRSYVPAELGVPAALSGAGAGPIVSAGDLDLDGVGELIVGVPADGYVYVVHPSVACGPRLLRDCNGDLSDGCETVVDTDDACGGCRRTCLNRPNAVDGTCDAGDCVLECESGFADCNGRPEDGCELADDASAFPNAIGAACTDGAPSLTCADGFEDCDGLYENGCEVDIAGDVTNCGGCGDVCTPDPGTGYTPSCDLGVCGENASSCAAEYGYVDCPTGCCCGFEDALCETGEACHLIRIHQDLSSPTFGICEPICPEGTGDCDDNPGNGCETDLTTRSNCGSCGNTCPVWSWSYYCVPGEEVPVTYSCKKLN